MMSSWKKGRVQCRFRARGNHPPALFSHFETLRQNSSWRRGAGGRQEACSNCRFRVDDHHHGLSSYEQVEDRKRAVKVKLSAASWRLETRTLSSHLLDLEWPGFGQRFDVIQNVTRHLKVQWPLQEQTLLADLQPDLGPSEFRSNLDNFEQKHKKCV